MRDTARRPWNFGVVSEVGWVGEAWWESGATIVALGRSMSIVYSDDAMATQLHPPLLTNPETGRKALFLGPGYTFGIADMDETEAQALLMELYRHQARPEFIYRHEWAAGTLAMWDNRAVVHAATGGYQGHRRLLQRITITSG